MHSRFFYLFFNMIQLRQTTIMTLILLWNYCCHIMLSIHFGTKRLQDEVCELSYFPPTPSLHTHALTHFSSLKKINPFQELSTDGLMLESNATRTKIQLELPKCYKSWKGLQNEYSRWYLHKSP